MGRFTLRLPQTLHYELESRAQQEGVSLNQYIVYALTRQVASSYTVHRVSDEELLAQRKRYDELLRNLGEPDEAAMETFLAEREMAGPDEILPDEILTAVRSKINAQKAAGSI
jgi:hypothetical protein